MNNSGSTKDEYIGRLEFAEEAAKYFAEHEKCHSYGELGEGNYLALRWGLGNDCVMVLKQDEFYEPFNFHQLVREFSE